MSSSTLEKKYAEEFHFKTAENAIHAKQKVLKDVSVEEEDNLLSVDSDHLVDEDDNVSLTNSEEDRIISEGSLKEAELGMDEEDCLLHIDEDHDDVSVTTSVADEILWDYSKEKPNYTNYLKLCFHKTSRTENNSKNKITFTLIFND
ncbi:hypothetical protein JTE90_019650 [Oedothorax gibbosus]|uniref:Uncharacterized protein n=1 Tax=Oedothorax gibbosus TaxID=931172 RepID=A0AAV6U0K1_9ARAC|nr:hypothetical protein JTE90_019650 [Oedothorax gibbosus]